ncbi:hypothetical protein GIB67_011311 [Kingdonia uniflora]|uniref:Uncharacterized protein n=1 Tax=Kingdonia uniflora TaxID=39325 RepID=A0A7J7MNZ7_9MAGN|nr:hypothetical protein GIB67_011311 [Kingdonia uniflora]
MQPTISVGYLFTNNGHLIWESLRKVYSQRENNTRIFQLSNEIENFKQLNPDFNYVRVHLLDRTPFLTLEEAHAYCFSDQSRRSHMPSISEIPSETSDMAARYAYPVPMSIPSQTSQTSSPSLSPLPATSGNFDLRKKYDYCGKWGI